jgi:CRISPR-associated protein Csb2
MRLHIEQTFPLGRFHATPWKVFPYDDPHGEWPPSPWRLLRAILARSFQLERETGTVSEEQRGQLVQAFASSTIAWHLPEFTWRGPGLRQYHPAEFKKVPAAAKEPGLMTYNTTKVQDNFWLTSPESNVLIWIIEGDEWTQELFTLLSACLDRLTYFGRAESISQTRPISGSESAIQPNCILSDRRSSTAVPVLSWKSDVDLAQALLTTDEDPVAKSTTPPGAVWRFAERPERPAAKAKPAPRRSMSPHVQLIQFAIGSRVEPRYSDAVRITERFRSRVLGRFAEHFTGARLKRGWADASDEVKREAVLLSGKDAQGKALTGHQHTHFFLHGELYKPTRLCLWRHEPFTDAEQQAILSAASHPLPLSYDNDPWTITLVPLDSMVPAPAGFAKQPSCSWKSLTPWVPPRHALDRKGRVKAGHSLEEQLHEALAEANAPGIDSLTYQKAGWVKSHQPSKSRDGRTNANKLGYEVEITFETPFSGPLMLGHSSHFGLGLFVPAD